MLPKLTWRRTTYSVLLLLLFSCQSSHWGQPQGNCDPTRHPQINNTPRYQKTFATKGGAISCLRVSWGSPPTNGVGLLVQVTKEGQLTAYQPAQNSFNAPPDVQLPQEAIGQLRHFELLVFGDAAPSSRDALQTLCTNTLNKPGYQCARNEQSECWFSIKFQPTTTDPQRKVAEVEGGCQLNAPQNTTPEPPREAQNEPIPETQRETASDAPTFERQPEPTKEPSTDEPTTEFPDASEPAKEKVPDEPKRTETPPDTFTETSPDMPAIQPWLTQASTIATSYIRGVAVDKKGDIYIAGEYFGNRIQFGTFQFKSQGGPDAFIAKLDRNGQWLWVKRIEQATYDGANALALDAAGNAYITGYFQETAVFGNLSIKSTGKADIFVAKIDSQGNWLWANKAGSIEYDYGRGISVDSKGNVYVVGNIKNQANFGLQTITTNTRLSDDGFVAKLDKTGKWLWAKALGATGNGYLHDITIDAQDKIYTTGEFRDQLTLAGTTMKASNADLLLAQIDGTGKWLWVLQGASAKQDIGRHVTVGPAGDVYVTGITADTITFGTKAYQTQGSTDIVVAKASKGKWQWATTAGAKLQDIGLGIVVDTQKNVYVTGSFTGTVTFGTQTLVAKGKRDIWIGKINALGAWQSVIRAGGTENDDGTAVTIGPFGGIFAIGNFRGIADFDTFNIKAQDNSSTYIWKLGKRP